MSKFISLSQIKNSLEELEDIHPFYGISFLACKAGKLPVGRSIEFTLDSVEADFLDRYYRPERSSDYYFRVFRPSDKRKRWLSSKYPSAGSQSTRTKRGFGEAFLHEKGTNLWGWQTNYVETLSMQLHKGKKVSAFHLAIWILRENEWSDDAIPENIIDTFLRRFHITAEEQRILFDTAVPRDVDLSQLLSDKKITWKEMRSVIGAPPDASPEEGGTLTYLEMRAIGPVKHIQLSLAHRLNLITGDNGLGKTFLLECAWWSLTGQWAGLPAYPSQGAKRNEPQITFQISSEALRAERVVVPYSWQSQGWPESKRRPTIPGLLIYARVDGSFAVWDPAKDYWSVEMIGREREILPRPFVFTKDQLWDGYEERSGGKSRVQINGLIRDWITWQNKPDKYPFETFKRVLRRLSPLDLGPLEPGDSVRIPYDARDIPTIKHSYGEVPIVYAAAGVRRIIGIAYLIVWAWEEHKAQSDLLRRKPQRRMVILVDEIEAHLHPKWQRTILPALLDVRDELSADLHIQFLVATHSPLIMVSAEPAFDSGVDKLFHLELMRREELKGGVQLRETTFVPHGRVDSWLMSDIFDLRQARSVDAEQAIEDAKSLQLRDIISTEDVSSVTMRLLKYLAPDDEYWPRWKYFAEQHGVKM